MKLRNLIALFRSVAQLMHSKFSDPNVLCPALAFLLERDNPQYKIRLGLFSLLHTVKELGLP